MNNENVLFCDVCEELAKLEKKLNIPSKDCLTQWWGDYAMYEPKFGVSDEKIFARLAEYKKKG